MGSMVRKIEIYSFFALFIMGLLVLKSIPLKAQFFFSFPGSLSYGGLFGSQVSPFPGSFYAPSYQLGSLWSSTGMNPYSDIRVLPSNYFSRSTQTKEMVEGEILVQFAVPLDIEYQGDVPRTGISEIDVLIEQYGVYEIKTSSSGQFYVLKFSQSHNEKDVSKAFANLSNYVRSSEPNYVTRKAHSSQPSFNTFTGGMSQTSFFPGLNFSYSGTGLNYPSQSIVSQPYYPNTQSFQFPSSFSQFSSSAWQTPSFYFTQPSFASWQQTTWQMPQINMTSLIPNWF